MFYRRFYKEVLLKGNNMEMFKYKKYILVGALFLLSLGYMSFFSQCVPFFFDNHEFHTHYIKMSNTELLSDMFHINIGGLSASPRPINAFIVKSLFYFFRFDYCAYRTAYSFIFAGFIISVYALAVFLFKRKSIAVLFAGYLMTNFPLYIHIMCYGPHLYGELFKILAILFFLRDIMQEKTSYARQLWVYVFSLFAVRSYISAFSVAGILPLFTLLYDRKKFLRYIPLFILIILIQFPVTLNNEMNTEYKPNLWSLQHVFINNIWENVTTPLPSYEELYYTSFTGILTFFGIWLIIFVSIGLLVMYWKRDYEENQKKYEIDIKLLFSLTSVWMICELPSYIFLPEHAIRYIFPFFVPFSLFVATLLVIFISKIKKYKTPFLVFILLMVISAMFINTSYIYAFRAGWGSSFIGFEGVMDYFAENHQNEIGVLYYASSVAIEYIYVNKSSSQYDFGKGITYIKSANLDDFSEEKIKEYAEQYDEFYVLQRVTSISRTVYPAVKIDIYPSLIHIQTIEGYNGNILFDRVNRYIMEIVGTGYQPNQIFIYKYSG